MGAYYSWAANQSISKLAVLTFTHSLSATPASMVARIFAHNATATMTAVPHILTLGTNVATFGALGDTIGVDIEVQMPHSIIQ
jgi:hypothetical protein